MAPSLQQRLRRFTRQVTRTWVGIAALGLLGLWIVEPVLIWILDMAHYRPRNLLLFGLFWGVIGILLAWASGINFKKGWTKKIPHVINDLMLGVPFAGLVLLVLLWKFFSFAPWFFTHLPLSLLSTPAIAVLILLGQFIVTDTPPMAPETQSVNNRPTQVRQDPRDGNNPFAAHYQQHIHPHIQELEMQRQEAVTATQTKTLNCIIYGVTSSAICCGGFVAGVASRSGLLAIGFAFTWFVLAVVLLEMWLTRRAHERAFQNNVKSRMYPKICRFFGEDFSFRQFSSFGVRTLDASGIIPEFEAVAEQDCIAGTYAGTALEIVEVTLSKKHDNHDMRVFHGLFIVLRTERQFTGTTVVAADKGIIGNALERRDQFSSMTPVRLESADFEENFEVYASNQVFARSVLPPTMMDRLLKVKHTFNDSRVQCSFFGNTVLLLLPSTRNRFELTSIKRPIDFVPETREILQQMDDIFRIIDALKPSPNPSR